MENNATLMEVCVTSELTKFDEPLVGEWYLEDASFVIVRLTTVEEVVKLKRKVVDAYNDDFVFTTEFVPKYVLEKVPMAKAILKLRE